MTKPIYRMYSFVNYYLSNTQHGIQTAHAIASMAVDGYMDSSVRDLFLQWAIEDRTLIILNGGNSAALDDKYTAALVDCAKLGLPIVKFHEDVQSLNGALTVFCILVPNSIWAAPFTALLTSSEYALYQLIKSHSLA